MKRTKMEPKKILQKIPTVSQKIPSLSFPVFPAMAALRLATTCNNPLRVAPQSPSLSNQARKHTFPAESRQFLVKQRPISCVNRVACQAAASPLVETAHTGVKKSPVLPFRVGHGFDLHRLEPNLPLIIGGVNIPHDRGCEAHSDGDVLLHCVVDAILGALGLPDIGQIFPDNDPKWKGAASSVFMKEAVRLMHEAGYDLGNLDATLILQRPKLSPHKEAIRSNLCELLGADPSVVNIKAKTHEKVDSLGENRSIAAHTVVLLMKK